MLYSPGTKTCRDRRLDVLDLAAPGGVDGDLEGKRVLVGTPLLFAGFLPSYHGGTVAICTGYFLPFLLPATSTPARPSTSSVQTLSSTSGC